MGKRRTTKKPIKKVEPKLDKIFDCPFCNHHKTVEVHLYRKQQIGTIMCRVCKEHYQMKINDLYESVDVYAEWIDQCDYINKGR